MSVNKQIPFPFLSNNPSVYGCLAIFSIIMESFTPFDRFMQKPFFINGKWLISSSFHNNYKWLLYTGVKVFIITIAIVAFCVLIYALASKKKSLSVWIKPILLLIISTALIPFVISSLKTLTGVYCPKSLIPYGGVNEHIGFIANIWNCGCTAGGHCFPAGHASGGFALMSLYYLPLNKKWRNVLFYFGFSLGWCMGLYQMARGEHFVTHTFTTMFTALFFITLFAKVLKPDNNEPQQTK